ncbi:WD repeat- and FYVE domain-containing protein 4 isoform X3 [Scophthalmus maximus]|uniref:WD repeat- and FYVE domain-containing protein 4 isoform X3 n=1 Tax=Scophthalmus maximus TaxID=52904 RepID=UPI001FA895D7|nr:WD repeat- and FYVE domain-containing protein 4 isoform X3 [Scophthalmus maximus]
MALTQVQDQTGKGERINKETGELSASGELSVSVDLKELKVEGSCRNPQLPQELREQLQELGIYTCSSPDHTSEQVPLEQREELLVKVLPLYIQVSEDGGKLEGLDVKGLAALTADTVILNINSRLAERPAEGAREEVVRFFQRLDEDRKCGTGESPGWLLLKSLLLLTADSSDILSCVTPGLPVALVKCMYLLVCLPAKKENTDIEETFQEPLTQVLLQLCRQPVNVERLVETQELQCLIIGLTSLWDQTSAPWRHQASCILKAVSAAATSNTVPSMLGKNCVRICIQNLLHISADVSGPLLAEVAVAVFSFIRDTYDLNAALFVEFDTNGGYQALENVLKRCEEGVSADHFQPVEELLTLIASFTLLGKTELKVALCVTNPQPASFKFDPPLTKGSAVKNLQAFHLLQASLLRSHDSLLGCQLLRTLQMIWERDPANFFLLEWTVQSMAQVATCVWQKPAPVQKRFFSLLEMVVFKFNYIPHETLRALLGVLKQIWAGTLAGGVVGIEFGVVALKCFHRMTVHSGMLAEVLSDWGLLELLLGELRRRAKILRKAGVVSSSQINHQNLPSVEDSERLLTTCMLQVVSTLTLRSIKNTVSVRDLGMVPYIKIFLDEDQYRAPTLSILEQLAEINPEEFMSTAIGAICSSTQQELRLKWDLLQSVLKVLENPNSWDAFRRAGGFTGLLSLVIDMEGALSDPPQGEVWKSLEHQPLLDLLLLALHIMALAVHLHTVNAHHFETGGFYERLADALLQLGCFHTESHEAEKWNGEEGFCPKTAVDNQSPGKSFHQFVELAEAAEASSSSSTTLQHNLPVTLRTCIKLLSYLDQFAAGAYSSQELNLGLEPEDGSDTDKEKLNGPAGHEGVCSGSPPLSSGSGPQSVPDTQGGYRSTAPSISTVCSESPHSRFTCDHVILHPGAIRVIMTLLPAVFTPTDPQLSMEVQFSLAHRVQAMVKPERNRQILCEGGLVSTLLAHCQSMLLTPNHPLHIPITRILEKLSSQSITHSDFRKFLCLGDPLMCLADKTAMQSPPVPASNGTECDPPAGSSVKTLKRTFSLLKSAALCESSVGSAIPVHQIINLVSMTSPRTYRPHRVSSSPAFVEFDMSESGYGCLFLPSLATVKGVTADSISTGGIGGDCRGFPPAAGLSFSCWFQINRFSSACDSHPIRLLSVVRHMSRTEQQYICLSISFSAYDGCLVISTEEEAFTYLDMMEPEVCTPTSLPASLRLRCSSMLVPGQWHHLAVVMAKDVKKSCLITAYFNGKALGTGKMKYIQPFPGQYISMDPTAVIDVCGLIGTPPLWKQHAALVWRVGPSYLFEEALSSEAMGHIYTQGTAYLGNFQALRNPGHTPDAESLPLRLVPEERISFGINPAISTLTTVVQIRENYNEVDCRLIAKEMGITSRDHSTPVFLARNISQHLSGTARTIGAALVGHFGVRMFSPSSASNGFLCVGGPTVVLSLVAMAPDDGSLYAAVKVLASVLETNCAMQEEMNRINGYKLLAFLLKMKRSLVSHRTLQLVLYLSSSVDLNSGSGCLKNTPAFQALLCDLEVWQNTSENLDLSVLNHFTEILKSSSDGRNAAVMHTIGLLPKLLFQLSDSTVTFKKVKIISCVITSLLKAHFTPLDMCRLGLFLVYTLPPLSDLTEGKEISDSNLSQDTPAQSSCPASLIWIRNQLLLALFEILNSDSLLNNDQQKTAFDSLGSDWFLLFLQPHLHPSTLKLGLMLLTHFLSNRDQQDSFREGVVPGTLIDGMEEPVAVMDNLRAHSWSYECPNTACRGFDVLQELLTRHTHLPQVYEALAALLLGKDNIDAADGKVHLDDILQSLIDSQADTPAQQLCVEAATILLELVKLVITRPIPPKKDTPGTDASWELKLPASLMQFLCLIHSLQPRDPLWSSPDFLYALAGVVYPLDSSETVAEPCLMSDGEETFKSYQTTKPVCDFIRILLMDNLINISANASTYPPFLLLEFSPDGASLEQRQSFQTELLELMMDIIRMLSQVEENNTHLNSQDSNQRPEGHRSTLVENVVLFSKTLLQKLYSGTFLGDSESLLNFLADQIVVALEKGQSQKEKTVSALYSCTNEVVLHFLSQPRHSKEEKQGVIRALQTFMERWDVVMATYNANVNFITCLLHCLLLIRSGSYPEGFGCLVQKVHNRTASSRLFPTKARPSAYLSNKADSPTDDGELVSLAETCWSKVMAERQHTLEETYKIEISATHRAEIGSVSMADISPLWEEMAHKAWLLHTESQKKRVASSSQRKFDMISSAVRSALGRPSKESVTVQEFLSWLESHRHRGHCMFENMRTNHLQLQASEWERVSSKWLRVEAELLRERALFGPGPGVLLRRDWVQDAAEGPNRTRSRIRRKTLRRSRRVLDTLCLGLRTGTSEENKNQTDGDTEPKILFEVGAEAKEDGAEGGQDCLTFFPVLNETPAVTESPTEPLTLEPCSHTQDCPDIRIILQELHPGEEVKAKMYVVMVSGLRVTEGVLLFGKESLLLCEGFTLSPSGDVCCRKHHPSSVRDSFISTMLSKDLPPASCRRWLYEEIKEARFMRFLLEDNAIEVFMKNGHSAFLVFLNKDHVSAYKRLSTVVSALKGRGVAEIIANARKTPVVEKAALVKWQKGEISNFEYLMHLNTIAGRTYNDLMQYPVFPWILADYHSETLDLSNPATFRDLSKPMGAQTEKRKQMFIQRFDEVENSRGEGDLAARCHYCTHYSSAIIVASFLVRIEPFSHTFQALQGGFDIPERMFYSVKKEWESASRDNMGDVRELIPEFFYLSDFLLNSNNMPLGCMEDGTALGDVELPPWAKGDPQEFIRVHREALESDYVSAHLHQWIDLIFGFRQQGPAAVESVNTFHPYFYAQRGRQNPKDPLIRSTILGYVSNFGQVPKQLFTKPHPPRCGSKKDGVSPPHPTPFFYRLDKLKTTAQPFRGRAGQHTRHQTKLQRGPVGQILCLEKEVLVLERNHLLLSHLSTCFFSWGFPDNSCAFGNYATEKTFAVCESSCDWGMTLCAACPNPTTIITGGTSTVVCVWDIAVTKDKLTHMRLRQPLYGHTDTVTCLAVSEVHSLIVSGSRDLTCILWDMEELCYITQLAGHTTSICALAINELTGEIASCAGPQLYLWTMKGQLLTCTDTSCGPRADILCVSFTQRQEWDNRNVVVTGCADGIIQIWKTEYTRTQLPGPPEELVSPGQDQTERDVRSFRQGECWERRLVPCRELSRSQAVSQRHYKNNPAITALTMSRSHATLLAGDAWGRVFTWTCE